MTDDDWLRRTILGEAPPDPLPPPTERRTPAVPVGVRYQVKPRPDYWLAAACNAASGRTMPDPDLPLDFDLGAGGPK